MATTAGKAAGIASSGGKLTQFVDRWIYAFTAMLFMATAIAGFVPDSIEKIATIRDGIRPPFPFELHVHAVLMAGWMTLLLVQATLQALDRKPLHRKLGTIGLFLAPAVVVAGILVVPATRGQMIDVVLAMPPGPSREGLAGAVDQTTQLLLVQLRIGIVFTLSIALALLSRRNDPELHKRLLILGTAALLSAAIDRIRPLPTTFPDSLVASDLYTLLLIAPMFLWDLFRLGKIHRAYLVWFAILIGPTIAAHWLWGSEWWLANGPDLVGLRSIT